MTEDTARRRVARPRARPRVYHARKPRTPTDSRKGTLQ